MMSGETCCRRVFSSGGLWGGSACGKKAKIQADGKWYCGIHSPEARAKRDAKSKERFQAFWAENDRQHAVKNARSSIIETARKATKQQASWEDVAEAVAKLNALESGGEDEPCAS